MNKKDLRKHFGILALDIKLLNTNSVNKCFLVETENKKFFLKKLFKNLNFDPKNIDSQIDIANHLKKKKLPVFVPIKNKQGKQVTSIEGEYYLIYNYHEIKPVKEINMENFNLAANYLKKFHNAMKDYKGSLNFLSKPLKKDIDSMTSFTEDCFDFRSKSTISLAKKSNNKFAKKVLKDAPMVKEAIIRSLHYIWNKKFSTETILHYDYSPHNLFFSNNKLLAISDFDFSHKGFVEVDVAKSAKFWSEQEKNGIDINKFKRFVHLYHKKSKTRIDWDLYYGLTLFLVLRRIVYASRHTLSKTKNLEFLYDLDIKIIKQLLKNKF